MIVFSYVVFLDVRLTFILITTLLQRGGMADWGRETGRGLTCSVSSYGP